MDRTNVPPPGFTRERTRVRSGSLRGFVFRSIPVRRPVRLFIHVLPGVVPVPFCVHSWVRVIRLLNYAREWYPRFNPGHRGALAYTVVGYIPARRAGAILKLHEL